MVPVILLIVLFFALQLLVLFCCVAAGNDPYSQFLSDEEQVEYLTPLLFIFIYEKRQCL